VNFPIPRNVGRRDRIARVVVGVLAAAAPVVLGAAPVIAVPIGLFATGIAMSGLLGRCSIYQALGRTTLE
jgi:hypothetical protein